jgi:hypothetical protein
MQEDVACNVSTGIAAPNPWYLYESASSKYNLIVFVYKIEPDIEDVACNVSTVIAAPNPWYLYESA